MQAPAPEIVMDKNDAESQRLAETTAQLERDHRALKNVPNDCTAHAEHRTRLRRQCRAKDQPF